MKVFLMSHIADCDGVTPVVLTDLVFNDYDYKLFEITDLEEFILNNLDNNFFDKYDKVFITDLCFSDLVAQKIINSSLKDKLQVLDHHISRLPMNKYDFITVIDEENGIKESGTSLYYKYLLKNYYNEILEKESIKKLVDLVRSGDTWEWKKTNYQEARDISTLLAYYGNDKYIEKYKKFIRENDTFYFDEIDKTLIEIDRKRIFEYIENCKDKVIIKDIKGYKVGIIFAELYRSELGNDLAEYYKDEVDFILIINMNRSLSFRGIKDNINLGEISHEWFSGYGHAKAAGAPLPENIKEEIIKLFLKEIN